MSEHQLALEKTYSTKNQKNMYLWYVKLTEEYKSTTELHGTSEQWETLLVACLMHKATVPQTVISSIKHLFDTLQNAATFVSYAIIKEIITFQDGMIVSKIIEPKAIKEAIAKQGYQLPMVIKPKLLNCNSDTGYIGSCAVGSILQNNAYLPDSYDLNLDHLNQVNSIPLTLVHSVIDNIPQLPPTRSKDETAKEFNVKLLTYGKYIKYSDVGMAEIGEKFYLTHGYDRRGRIYTRGYHFTYQGADHNKASIAFANKQILGDY